MLRLKIFISLSLIFLVSYFGKRFYSESPTSFPGLLESVRTRIAMYQKLKCSLNLLYPLGHFLYSLFLLVQNTYLLFHPSPLTLTNNFKILKNFEGRNHPTQCVVTNFLCEIFILQISSISFHFLYSSWIQTFIWSCLINFSF